MRTIVRSQVAPALVGLAIVGGGCASVRPPTSDEVAVESDMLHEGYTAREDQERRDREREEWYEELFWSSLKSLFKAQGN